MGQLPIGDIGPCEVTWNYGGANPVIITPHLGKVKISMADAVTDVHIDGQGVAPIESFFEGATVELEVPMARSTLSQLANMIGYRDLGTLVGHVLTLHNVAGIEMYAQAKMIVIKPLCIDVPDPDPHKWIILYKCHPYRDYELGYDRSGQRVHMVKFKVFPDADNADSYYQEGAEIWCDDFCEVLLDPKWTTHEANGNKTITIDPSPACTVTIAVNAGENAQWWIANNLAPKIHTPLGIMGPCRITTKINSIDGDPPGGINDCTAAGIFIGTQPEGTGDFAYVYKWMYERNGSSGYDGLRVRRNNASWAEEVGLAHPLCPIWLRINITVDNSIHFLYSEDGITWSEYSHLVVTGYDIANCFVGIYAENNVGTYCMGNIGVSAIFDSFCIEGFI